MLVLVFWVLCCLRFVYKFVLLMLICFVLSSFAFSWCFENVVHVGSTSCLLRLCFLMLDFLDVLFCCDLTCVLCPGFRELPLGIMNSRSFQVLVRGGQWAISSC